MGLAFDKPNLFHPIRLSCSSFSSIILAVRERVRQLTPDIIHNFIEEHPDVLDLVNGIATTERSSCFPAAVYTMARSFYPELWDKEVQLSYLHRIAKDRRGGVVKSKGSFGYSCSLIRLVGLEITRCVSTKHNARMLGLRKRNHTFPVLLAKGGENVTFSPPAIVSLIHSNDANISHAMVITDTNSLEEFKKTRELYPTLAFAFEVKPVGINLEQILSSQE